MRVTSEQYILLTPEQKDRVTHIEIVDSDCYVANIGCPNCGKLTLRCDCFGPFEEYPGEADSRGVDSRGYNKP